MCMSRSTFQHPFQSVIPELNEYTCKVYGCDIFVTGSHQTPEQFWSYHNNSNLYWLPTQNHSEREVATKQGATDEPVLPKSVDVCTESRFQLIESWKQFIHSHTDVLLINLLRRVGRAKEFSETFTEWEQELAEQLAISWIETACAPCILTLASFVFIRH